MVAGAAPSSRWRTLRQSRRSSCLSLAGSNVRLRVLSHQATKWARSCRMTFTVAGARRFVCRNSRYCSREGCIVFPLPLVIDHPCYFTTAVQILRHVKQGRSSPNAAPSPACFELLRAGEGNISGMLAFCQRIVPLPSLCFSEHLLSCAA